MVCHDSTVIFKFVVSHAVAASVTPCERLLYQIHFRFDARIASIYNVDSHSDPVSKAEHI